MGHNLHPSMRNRDAPNDHACLEHTEKRDRDIAALTGHDYKKDRSEASEEKEKSKGNAVIRKSTCNLYDHYFSYYGYHHCVSA